MVMKLKETVIYTARMFQQTKENEMESLSYVCTGSDMTKVNDKNEKSVGVWAEDRGDGYESEGRLPDSA